MSTLAAVILAYVLGLVTAAILGGVWMMVRGGQDVRDSDRHRADRVTTKGRGW